LPDRTIIRCPDCAFSAIEQVVLAPKMNVHLTLEDRLSILRTEDQFRRWNSLDDERFCILCERRFNGRQVEIRRFANGKHELHCPTEGCDSGPYEWVYPGTPLISDIVDPDWWSASGKEPRRLSALSSDVQFQRQEHT
jgi:hypothetical protein